MEAGASRPFGQQLRQLREAAGLTQEELAERAGLSVKAVSALERGQRQRPYPHTVRALADALGLSASEQAALAGAVPKRDSAPVATAPVASALPVPPAALIGRRRELVELIDLLRAGSVRLATLTGPGGVGKTRLALEVAACLSAEFPAGVRFVPLALLGEAGLVLPTIAQALGLADAGGRSVREQLVAHLGSQRWLLVLDNIEHVIASAPEIAELLAACPGLVLLATSRAPLRIRAEHEYPVRPLAVPDLSHVPELDEVAHVSSVQLFVERAQAAAPSFELTQANCAAVAAVCRRLEGLPLALELVAARVRVLSPTEMLARLDRLLPLLVGGSRDLPERQQTMRAAIDWSNALLSPPEQALFRRLAVFAGGCTLEAAEAVTAWGQIVPGEVIELLSVLVEQSLVVAEPDPDGLTRYRMLEPIRQFAAGCVEEAGETVTLADRRLDWCLALAQRAAGELRGAGQQHWLNRLEAEHDNLRAALAWCEQDGARSTAGLQLATALWRFWSTRGYLTEGRRWLESALALGADAPPGVRADGLNAAGNLAREQGERARSGALHEQALALRRELGDSRGIGLSLNNLGTVLMDQGDYRRATSLYDEALALFRQFAGAWEVAIALHNLGIVLGYRGDYERAEALLDEALLLWERLGETVLRARSLDAQGEMLRRKGALERAAVLHETSLALRREIGDTRGTAISLRNLGAVACYRGDTTLAVHLLDEALDLDWRLGNTRGVALTQGLLAGAAREQGDRTRALALYREALAAHHQLGTSVGVADCLLGLAAMAAETGDVEHGARLLGASDAVRETTDEAIPAIDQPEYERVVAAIASQLPPQAFEAARAAGRALRLDDMIVVEAYTASAMQPTTMKNSG